MYTWRHTLTSAANYALVVLYSVPHYPAVFAGNTARHTTQAQGRSRYRYDVLCTCTADCRLQVYRYLHVRAHRYNIHTHELHDVHRDSTTKGTVYLYTPV